MDAYLSPLADAVLPLIRTKRQDLWRYSASNEHGMSMQEGAALIELAVASPQELPACGVKTPTPKETYAVTHKALASAIKVIGRADDSSGIIGGACRTLIRVHPLAAYAAGVPQVKLAEWVWKFHFDEKVDYFNLDPVAYAPALGGKGVAHLRALVATLRTEIASSAGEEQITSYNHREYLLRWFEQRFAVLDRDFDAIVTTHLLDGKVAAQYEDVAEAFEEIGEWELAIFWSHRALLFDHGHQSRTAAQRWWRLLEEYQPGELPIAARLIFDRWPDADSGARFLTHAGDEAQAHVTGALGAHPDELIRFQLSALDDPRLAWQTAQEYDRVSSSVWDELAKAYFSIDPRASIAVQLQIIGASLTEANTRKYRPAALHLKKLRRDAQTAQAEALTLLDHGIAELRERYKRRPSFLAALDKAKLP